MKLEYIPEEILESVRNRNLFTDRDIEEMDARKIFHEYCNWHGLINWGESLWDTMEELREAEIEELNLVKEDDE